MKETTTIRISKDLKKRLDEIKGDEISQDKWITHLLDFFLNKK